MPIPPAYQAALGRAAKARRKELKLTQEQVHLRFEIHQRWISNVETGKRNPAYASLRRLAAALDLSTSQLIARAEAIEATEAIEAAEAAGAVEAGGAVEAAERR